MLEAMASGLPVFATHHGGIPEAIENGISGVLVAERDHEGLARALLDAVPDRHLLGQFGRLGSQSVAEKFDQHAQVRRLEDVYLKIL
jgi:colanic acid/amylovoran biosynthesis glycosyltransferase